jgi:hypothetical protein
MRSLIPLWTDLRRFGESRTLRSSYAWFVIVPVAARVIAGLRESQAPWVSLVGLHNVTLPFSWQVFFFAALCVSMGSVIYELGCPRVLREYRTWREFSDSGEPDQRLLGVFIEVLSKSSPYRGKKWLERSERVVRDDFLEYCANAAQVRGVLNEQLKTKDSRRLFTAIDSAIIADGQAIHVASLIWQLAERSGPLVRTTCAGCYAAGLALIGLVIGQNVVVVLDSIRW